MRERERDREREREIERKYFVADVQGNAIYRHN